MRILVLLASIGLLLALTASCDRNTEAFVEGEQPRSPDLARIFPESKGAEGAAERSPAVPSPASPGEAMPRAVAQAQAPAAGASISGTITLAPDLADSAPSGAILFVIARPSGVASGPPLAVQRFPAPRFPLAFEIGPANVMIPSMRFEGDIELAVRLDADGNAMTKEPGDLSGGASGALRPGAAGVQIVLDTKL